MFQSFAEKAHLATLTIYSPKSRCSIFQQTSHSTNVILWSACNSQAPTNLAEVSECLTEIQELSAKVMEQEQELNAMKKAVEIARTELGHTKHTLKDITNKLRTIQKQRDCAQNQAHKSCQGLGATVADSVHYEEELSAKRVLLSFLNRFVNFRRENATLSSSTVFLLGSVDKSDQSIIFCFQTKEGGKVYTPTVRELCYTLLANQLC